MEISRKLSILVVAFCLLAIMLLIYGRYSEQSLEGEVRQIVLQKVAPTLLESEFDDDGGLEKIKNRTVIRNIDDVDTWAKLAGRMTRIDLDFKSELDSLVRHNTPCWGLLTTHSMNTVVFYPIAILALLFMIALTFRKSREESLELNKTLSPLTIGLVSAVAAAIILWFFTGGEFFWKNIFSGPVSLFGNYSEIMSSYSVLPPDFELVSLWDQTTEARVISVLLGGIYILLLSLIARQISYASKSMLRVFFFMASAGLLAVFAVPGDFGVVLLLAALNVFLTVRFLEGKSGIYLPGIILVISVLFHPMFALFAVALLFVKLSSPLLTSGKPGIPIILLLLAIGAGIGLSLMHRIPFTAVLLPETSTSEVFNISHLWGFANQLVMVSHFIWLIALVTAVYMFTTSRVTEPHGMLFGAWFFASSAFYLFSYSIYGWILGYSASTVVVFPAILWLAYFMGKLNNLRAARTFGVLIITNLLVTIPLLITVHSSSAAIDLFSPQLAKENAFDGKFLDGKNALALGIMYSEHFERHENAISHFESFYRKYPLDIVGRYQYGWALSNIPNRIVKADDLLKKVEETLIEENKLYWEFNYRIGIMRLIGHNATFGSISLERAAAEKNTAEIAKNLGIAYEVLKVYDSMGSKHRQAIELGDSAKENFYKVAFAAEKLADSAKALEYYLYGIEHFPSYMANYEYVARYYFLNQKHDSLEALADHGLKHLGRSRELEASMILVYHYTGRTEKCNSAYAEFMDYFRTYPGALNDWGAFLEENGLIYKGRKMQAADVSENWANLKAALGFYHYYRGHGLPDSAKVLIDRFIELNDIEEIDEVLQTVRRFDTVLWPKSSE